MKFIREHFYKVQDKYYKLLNKIEDLYYKYYKCNHLFFTRWVFEHTDKSKETKILYMCRECNSTFSSKEYKKHMLKEGYELTEALLNEK